MDTKDILKEYIKQVKLDKTKENYDLPEGVNEQGFSDDMKDAYRKEIDRLRNNTDDLEQVYQKFHDTYRKLDEQEINAKCATENVRVVIKHAYCPECGKEIISQFPILYNPYTKEKIARYDCECGAKFNMEHSYPRIIYVNDNNVEITAFNE